MYVYYGDSLYQMEQYARAENIYFQAMQQRKNIIKKKSGAKPQAEKDNKDIISDIDIKYKLYLCYVKLKMYQKAIYILQTILARSRTVKVNMALGYLYKDTGQERPAIAAFKEVLRVGF